MSFQADLSFPRHSPRCIDIAVGIGDGYFVSARKQLRTFVLKGSDECRVTQPLGNKSENYMAQFRLVETRRCRMWDGHDRLPDFANDRACEELIESIRTHGQRQPVLGRVIRSDPDYDIELIFGARRLYAAQQLGIALLADVRQVTDSEAIVEMDIENRLRKDISPYERGVSYKRWLSEGHFNSQGELAGALGVSESTVSRLLRFAELPAVVVGAFKAASDIKEEWAVTLASHCKDPQQRLALVRRARSIDRARVRTAEDVLSHLVGTLASKRSRHTHRDDICRTKNGEQLFRVCYRAKSVNIVIPARILSPSSLRNLQTTVRLALERSLQDGAREVPLGQLGGSAMKRDSPAREHPVNRSRADHDEGGSASR